LGCGVDGNEYVVLSLPPKLRFNGFANYQRHYMFSRFNNNGTITGVFDAGIALKNELIPGIVLYHRTFIMAPRHYNLTGEKGAD
jgi:hypothetical protein